MTEAQTRRAFLVLLVVVITAAFLYMLRAFLLTVLMATITAALVRPAHERVVRLFRGRRAPAALASIGALLVLVFTPLFAVLGAVAAEALTVSESLAPRAAELLSDPGAIGVQLRALPGYDLIAPYEDEIGTRAGALLDGAGAFVFDAVSAATRATAVIFVLFAIFLYALYFFLVDGQRLLEVVRAHLPLARDDQERMLATFVSTTRATIKGTLLVSILQGAIGGLAFAALGIDGAVFWGAVMTLAAVVPGLGSGLVWGPAALILAASGQIWRGVALAVVGALLIGLIDNVLRPRLVGRDVQLHELLIFLSTLGGLMVFGAPGFVVGPILAALFTTVWDVFGASFRHGRPAEPAADG